MNRPFIIVGGGGHAKVLIEALRSGDAEIKGVIEVDPSMAGSAVLGVGVIGGDEALSGFAPDDILLVNGVGSTGRPAARREVFERFRARGYTFATVVHPDAVLGCDVELGEGVQVMAGVIVQPATRIGANTIINTRASVDHDCRIGAHCHVAPGATLSGSVVLRDSVHVGAGAIVIQGLSIGRDSVVGAGAVVVSNVPEKVTVVGPPARTIE